MKQIINIHGFLCTLSNILANSVFILWKEKFACTWALARSPIEFE